VTDLTVLAPLGIYTVQDALLHLPLRYLDLTKIIPIGQALSGDDAQVEGVITEARVIPKPRRTLLATIEDDSDTLNLRFFNFYPSQLKQLAVGNKVRVFGTVRGGFIGREMVHPTVRSAQTATLPECLTPVYPTVAGVTQPAIRKILEPLVAQCEWTDTVPAEWLAQSSLGPISQAIRELHAPPKGTLLSPLLDKTSWAWQRVIFDELLAQQIALRIARNERNQLSATALNGTNLVSDFMTRLPFRLTGAQERVWREIAQELRGTVPMNRLLQGDVGSGKTIVAALAACLAIGSGHQAALMAPTEILAEQHLNKLAQWLSPLGVRVAWLAGSLKESQKKLVKASCAKGEIDLLVGTHALIEDSVEFNSLGLAIVDEQHRFGVGQRLALRSKDRSRDTSIAHQMMMSATPIPRTLSMSYLADLDVSVIDELPPGRTPVTTKLISQERRDEVIEHVASAVAQGSQVYWVCPLIEESETLQLQTAVETFEQLQLQFAQTIRVGLVHGRLSAQEKADVMSQFSAGHIDLLVATTVIEVGVDVPRASLMIIEHAERFGLAQLHQLRGRVGRGSSLSTCVLLFRSPLSQTGKERLKIIFESSDGFEIARRDLQLRGPGEFLGARQSGQPLLRFADIERDIELLELASRIGDRLLRERPDLAKAHLTRWYSARADFLKA
jgi:ATP-dependent DNA helicase RecG